jgi:uncharacterized protein YggU (UPF0235/DUF167 family)
VKAPASEGRANAEAERLLSDALSVSVQLVRGAKSRRKSFEVDLEPEQIEQRLREAFGG